MVKFRPKPGQIDYTKARWAPVINCVVCYQDKLPRSKSSTPRTSVVSSVEPSLRLEELQGIPQAERPTSQPRLTVAEKFDSRLHLRNKLRSITARNKILLVQRSSRLHFYPGYWNGVSGFLDDQRNLREKVEDELTEELGIDHKNIISVQLGQIFHQDSPEYQKTWIVHPILVEINTNQVVIDYEAQDFQWVDYQSIREFKLLPGFDLVLDKLFTEKMPLVKI